MANSDTFLTAAALATTPATGQDQQRRTDAITTTVNELIQNGVPRWTPQSIRNADKTDVMLALFVIDRDRPDLSARMLPPGMSMDQFHHMLLREMDRRDLFGEYYLLATVGPSREGRETFERALRNINAPVTVRGRDVTIRTRAPEIGAQEETTTTGAMRAAIYQSGVASILFENNIQIDTDTNREQNPNFFLTQEVITALGLPPRPVNGINYGARLDTDTSRLTLGYAMSRLDEFNPAKTPNATLTVTSRPEPITLPNGTTRPVTVGDFQPRFCRSIQTAYEQGLSQFTPRDLINLSLLQGRGDEQFPDATDPSWGLSGACPPRAAVSLRR